MLLITGMHKVNDRLGPQLAKIFSARVHSNFRYFKK